MRKNYLILYLILFSLPLFSQKYPIGTWNSYLPYAESKYVTQSDANVYFATELSIMIIDKTDLSITFWDKVNKLNDVGIALIKYNSFNDDLVVAYSNSNIDIIHKDGTITNVPDIQLNQKIRGDRAIKDIYFDKKDAYLSTSFGLTKLNLTKSEFVFTAFTPFKINMSALYNGFLYFASDSGMYRIKNFANAPFSNYNSWEKLNLKSSQNYFSKVLTIYENKLFLGVNDSVGYLNNNLEFVGIHSVPSQNLTYLTSEGKHLLTGYSCKDQSCGLSTFSIFDSNLNKLKTLKGDCVDIALYAIEDKKGTIWFSDAYRNFRYLKEGNTSCNLIRPLGQYFKEAANIVSDGNRLYVTTGGVDIAFFPKGNLNGFYSLLDGKWTVYNGDTYNNRGEFNKISNSGVNVDAYRVAISPFNGNVYVGSQFRGIVELKNDTVANLFDVAGTAIQGTVGDPGTRRIGGLDFDPDNNLWIVNTGALNPLKVFKKDRTWKNMLPLPNSYIFQIVVDSNNLKWMALNKSEPGILVYDNGKSIDDTNDDRIYKLNSNNSKLGTIEATTVLCLAVDLDGRVWAGTDNGVVYFDCGTNISQCKGTAPISVLDNIPEYLLKGQIINTIAVDGANRKWFGTNTGIFVVSPDGTEQISKFNANNSPLFDNIITALSIDKKTGLVWIGTEKGLMSYQSDATFGGVINEDKITVFPNPVRPDYDGPIAIKGLARDANVKITDLTGRIVFETKSNGGQAIWQGKDLNNNKVATGVYLVFATNTQSLDFTDAVTSKILFIK
jgi:hypothetical protein